MANTGKALLRDLNGVPIQELGQFDAPRIVAATDLAQRIQLDADSIYAFSTDVSKIYIKFGGSDVVVSATDFTNCMGAAEYHLHRIWAGYDYISILADAAGPKYIAITKVA